MAFNVIGNTAWSLQAAYQQNNNNSNQDVTQEYFNGEGPNDANKQSYISPMDDLAFDMYQVTLFILSFVWILLCLVYAFWDTFINLLKILFLLWILFL